MFHMDFAVDGLCVTILRSSVNGYERPLGNCSLHDFRLGLSVLNERTVVNINLK